jgi:hypothetical protein
MWTGALFVELVEKLNVFLAVRSAVPLVQKLGILLQIFSTKLTDESSVHVLPGQALPSKDIAHPIAVVPAMGSLPPIRN